MTVARTWTLIYPYRDLLDGAHDTAYGGSLDRVAETTGKRERERARAGKPGDVTPR